MDREFVVTFLRCQLHGICVTYWHEWHFPKGRCVWVNLAEKPVGEFDEDEEEEEKEVEADEPEPEVGPPLLTPLSEDAGEPSSPLTDLEMYCRVNLELF